MASIIEYLPGINHDYWQDFAEVIEPTKPTVIPVGARNVQLLSSSILNKRGLILEFLLNSSNPNLVFTIQADNRKVTGTLSNLYDGGYTQYVPGLPFLSEYDTTTNDYVLNFVGELPFQQDVYAYVSNPTTSPIVLSGMIFHGIIFKSGFYRELANLISGKE